MRFLETSLEKQCKIEGTELEIFPEEYSESSTEINEDSPSYINLIMNEEQDIENIEPENIELDADQQRIRRHEAARRGRGQPRKILTGNRGRPRKEYPTIPEEPEEVADFAYLTEVLVREAMISSDAQEWTEAMTDEVQSILRQDTWEIIDRPENRHVVGSRMVLRNKIGSDGQVEKRKARIVARGFSQRPGTDFYETFAPVARLKSVRIALSLAASKNMIIRQLDVTSAYLNGTLEEEVFMETPEYLEESLKIIGSRNRDPEIAEKARKMLEEISSGDKVCLMKKALYGLRQPGRVWHKRLDSEIRKFGASPTNSDPCVYTKGQGDNMIIIVTYVDDFLVIASKPIDADSFRNHLQKEFMVKDLGQSKHCLGMDFTFDKNCIRVSQTNYINEILKKFGMSECNPISTPLEAGAKLGTTEPWNASDGEKPPFRELVGALMYLSVTTRPDLAHSTSVLSQFNNNFGKTHWSAAKRILRYLKGSSELGIVLGSSNDQLTGFADADWGGSVDDARS